jgi:peptidyl-tRNA hydrolase
MDLKLPEPKDPYLYILMRSDLASLNPGKAVAQGAHAANQCAFEIGELTAESMDIINLFEQWQSSTPQGFGVTITLDVSGEQLPLVVDAAKRMGIAAGVTHDPSYPLQDGAVIHSIPLDTCGYVFGNKSDLSILLGRFDLLK